MMDDFLMGAVLAFLALLVGILIFGLVRNIIIAAQAGPEVLYCIGGFLVVMLMGGIIGVVLGKKK